MYGFKCFQLIIVIIGTVITHWEIMVTEQRAVVFFILLLTCSSIVQSVKLNQLYKFSYYTGLPIEEYVKVRGYPIERHTFPTEDGYMLTYHRIPYGKAGKGIVRRRPVLLQHGILNSSAGFMALNSGLAYVLADSGYDVWMGNARGNVYSRAHKRLNPNTDKEFWDFSFHEMGNMDLPAGIDYILKVTGKPRLFYIGFSMGTTMFWILGATRPDYMDKVDAMIALAPVARIKNMLLAKNRLMFYLVRKFTDHLMKHGVVEIMPQSGSIPGVMQKFCDPSPINMKICMTFIRLMQSQNDDQFDMESNILSLVYFPAGASLKTYIHFLQIAQSGRFQQFDYGKKSNRDHYGGSDNPPEYELTKVTSPIYMVCGHQDTFSVMEDVMWLRDQLPAKPPIIIGTSESFTHTDFLYGKDVQNLLHSHIAAHFRLNAVKF